MKEKFYDYENFSKCTENWKIGKYIFFCWKSSIFTDFSDLFLRHFYIYQSFNQYISPDIQEIFSIWIAYCITSSTLNKVTISNKYKTIQVRT